MQRASSNPIAPPYILIDGKGIFRVPMTVHRAVEALVETPNRTATVKQLIPRFSGSSKKERQVSLDMFIRSVRDFNVLARHFTGQAILEIGKAENGTFPNDKDITLQTPVMLRPMLHVTFTRRSMSRAGVQQFDYPPLG